MADSYETNEFSFVVWPDAQFVTDMELVRALNPDEPVRSDPPYLPGLAIANTPYAMSDERLANLSLEVIGHLPYPEFSTSVVMFTNRLESFYGLSATAYLECPQEVRANYNALIAATEAEGCWFRPGTTDTYLARVTAKLGVRYSDEELDEARSLLPKGRVVDFNDWGVMRIFYEQDTTDPQGKYLRKARYLDLGP